MSWLLFLDEFGHDHRTSPYEVRGGIALQAEKLWPFVQHLQLMNADRVIVSGFHSPLKRQVLRSVLRRRGRVFKVLARDMTDYRPTAEEHEPLAAGRMLVITTCPSEARRTTRETALARNRLVLALAGEIVSPHVANGSPLAALLNERRSD